MKIQVPTSGEVTTDDKVKAPEVEIKDGKLNIKLPPGFAERESKPKLEIVHYPDPVLSTPCALVEVFDEALVTFAHDMLQTLHTLDWGNPVGLAAPQVGKSIQLFIAEDQFYINPVVTWATKAPRTLCHEGCYSKETSRFDYPAMRISSIRLHWQDIEGYHHEARFNGFHAQVIQHELDHLNIDWDKHL